MSATPAPQQEPITDSPWFWLYLFATTALILLVVFRSKLDIRQAEIERQHQARELATQVWEGSPDVASDDHSVAVSTPENTLIGWNYIYVVLGLLVSVGWIRLWYVRFRKPNQSPPETER
ncbi:hypothetical protein [Blastopirellula marina]|uniref:Uncharacterized protein n=1 Tax=Blastopirellula marina TaxID=124 RepID=A0A2S8G9F8_9BACT|nr:hypothetical protein [Blastopirellula marina]PQO40901.1 hypothetical protein C5Y98_04800 [Blastopirellula marina]PTL45783.1 hypothetical protein C5Y97_04800 [Blastopirellula marina]